MRWLSKRQLQTAVVIILFGAVANGQYSSEANYFDPVQGSSSHDLVRRALAANGELAAARLEIERARGRLRQAGLRPNPSFEIEQSTSRSADERETSVGVAIPLELGAKRKRRLELAQAELEAVEASVADHGRRLTLEVMTVYADALSALRELETTESLNQIDLQTARFVQARVNEGESAPLELNLLRTEVDRFRSRRTLVAGRLTTVLFKLKTLAGIPAAEPLRLSEDFTTIRQLALPQSLETAIDIALRHRPDLRLARLNEEVAEAGLKLAQASPDLTAFTRYSSSRSAFEDTPVGVLRDRDKTLTFGVSVTLPIFNRNQGNKAEAAALISQARTRREFLEQLIRSEVQSAYARYEAARSAALTFEQGVIARSTDNIRVIRAAYELGQLPITDLLLEQRRLLDSQREYTETLTERYRALADLRAALGGPVN